MYERYKLSAYSPCLFVYAAHRRRLGMVCCGQWTDRQRRNVDQVDVMRYNSPNNTEYADAVSRAMKNRVRDVHQTLQRMHQ